MFTEGTVGRTYLTKRGVPAEAIIVEGEGESTAQSITAVGEIMSRMGLKSPSWSATAITSIASRKCWRHAG